MTLALVSFGAASKTSQTKEQKTHLCKKCSAAYLMIFSKSLDAS